MVEKISWMGIDIGPVDAAAFYRTPIQHDRGKLTLGTGWQQIGGTKYPDPFSKLLLDRYPDRPFIIGFMRCGTHWM